MTFYHIFITLSKEKDGYLGYVEYNQEKRRVEKVVEGYNSGKKFSFFGMVFHHSEILQVSIYKSEEHVHNGLILPNGKKIMDESSLSIMDFLNKGLIRGIVDATSEFDIVPPQEESTARPKQRKEIGTKNEVFIVHGRDDKQALLLQKHLDKKLSIDAKMFEDFKEESGSSTIIELLEYIWEKAGYAFIVTTAEDLGVLREEFEKSKNDVFRGTKEIEVAKACNLLDSLRTRARQNVVFEFGLFMGTLGRDNVCCLLQEGTQERPSDIDGILYTAFTKSIEERFGEIDAKLKKAGLVRA